MKIRHIILFVLSAILMLACYPEKHVPDGSYMLKSVNIECDNPVFRQSNLQQYYRQVPNSKWFSAVKVPLAVYSLSGTDTTKWINRTLQNLGEAPVLIDSALTQRTISDITLALQNKGYLDASVKDRLDIKGKKAKLTYEVTSGEPYIIREMSYDIKDDTIRTLLTKDQLRLRSGQVFSVDALEDERRRVASYLQDIGYYQFNKEYIRYDVDSSVVDKTVNVQMNLAKFRRNNNTAPSSHPQFIVRSVNYDTVAVDKVRLRASVVEQNTAIKAGELYNASHLRQTYNNFSRLQAVRYTSIHFDEIPDSGLLDCHIQLQKQKINSLQFQPEGTNTAGDFGAAASLTYQNRNMFRGSEVFSITPRVAYEAISQLEGYKNEDYVEYGVESSLTFPRILFPFIPDRKFNVQNATSEISVSYNLQNRPEFHRRLFNAGWRYRWSNTSRHTQYKLDLIDINYLWMPWISDTFKHDYIDSVSNRNVLLRYNYEDLLVMRIGFGYTWSNHGNTWRFNVETAGNVLSALTSPLNMKQNEDGDYKFLGIAFSQYVKGDFEYSHLIQIDEKNNLVLHGRLGIAYPYGNSKMLPFEKRYFSGGANSLRGWSVRALGPGGYKGKDGRIDFINQTGDLRLDLNAELRSMLFWKFQSAVFIDAGNIWTLREYADQPEGQFHFNTFLKQIAANYGVGLRLNLDYFMVRLDLGVKAINPVYNTTREHFPIIHPSFKRDLALHFAVGMPF